MDDEFNFKDARYNAAYAHTDMIPSSMVGMVVRQVVEQISGPTDRQNRAKLYLQDKDSARQDVYSQIVGKNIVAADIGEAMAQYTGNQSPLVKSLSVLAERLNIMDTSFARTFKSLASTGLGQTAVGLIQGLPQYQQLTGMNLDQTLNSVLRNATVGTRPGTLFRDISEMESYASFERNQASIRTAHMYSMLGSNGLWLGTTTAGYGDTDSANIINNVSKLGIKSTADSGYRFDPKLWESDVYGVTFNGERALLDDAAKMRGKANMELDLGLSAIGLESVLETFGLGTLKGTRKEALAAINTYGNGSLNSLDFNGMAENLAASVGSLLSAGLSQDTASTVVKNFASVLSTSMGRGASSSIIGNATADMALALNIDPDADLSKTINTTAEIYKQAALSDTGKLSGLLAYSAGLQQEKELLGKDSNSAAAQNVRNAYLDRMKLLEQLVSGGDMEVLLNTVASNLQISVDDAKYLLKDKEALDKMYVSMSDAATDYGVVSSGLTRAQDGSGRMIRNNISAQMASKSNLAANLQDIRALDALSGKYGSSLLYTNTSDERNAQIINAFTSDPAQRDILSKAARGQNLGYGDSDSFVKSLLGLGLVESMDAGKAKLSATALDVKKLSVSSKAMGDIKARDLLTYLTNTYNIDTDSTLSVADQIEQAKLHLGGNFDTIAGSFNSTYVNKLELLNNSKNLANTAGLGDGVFDIFTNKDNIFQRDNGLATGKGVAEVTRAAKVAESSRKLINLALKSNNIYSKKAQAKFESMPGMAENLELLERFKIDHANAAVTIRNHESGERPVTAEYLNYVRGVQADSKRGIADTTKILEQALGQPGRLEQFADILLNKGSLSTEDYGGSYNRGMLDGGLTTGRDGKLEVIINNVDDFKDISSQTTNK